MRTSARNGGPKKQPEETAESAKVLSGALNRRDEQRGLQTLKATFCSDEENNRMIIVNLRQVTGVSLG